MDQEIAIPKSALDTLVEDGEVVLSDSKRDHDVKIEVYGDTNE